MIRILALTLLAFSLAAPAMAQSSLERTDAAIKRIGRLDRKLHAVIAIDPTARDQARAADQIRFIRYDPHAITGEPVLIKDNIEAAGPLPTTAGSLALKDNVSGRDAGVVTRLRAAHAVILGKTNLSEWANIRSSASMSGWSGVGGQTHNAYALDRNPCGSSAGSAVAVAAGMVAMAVGTETNGSVTCPAAMNGIVGLKPTVGLVSRAGIIPISVSQDTAGPMAATVTDAARLLSAMAGSDPADPATAEADAHRIDYAGALDAGSLKGARIGVLRFATGFSILTDGAFERALDVLRARGAVLVDIKSFDRSRINAVSLDVLLAEFKVGVNAYLASTPPVVKTRTLADLIAFDDAHAAQEMPIFGQDLFVKAEATQGLDDPDYKAKRDLIRKLAGPEGIDRMLKDNDVVALVGPTMPPAFLSDPINGDRTGGGGAGGIAAVAGYPHLTVPMGLAKGLPVGLSFIGPAWSEARLLSLGYAYEQASHARVAPKLAR